MKKAFSLLALLLMVSCSGSSASSSSKMSPASDGLVEDSALVAPDENFTMKFMDLVNEHRKTLKLKPFEHVDDLAQIAFEHSQNMAQKSVTFGHTGFSSRCGEARDVMNGGNLCAENVAMGQKSPEAVFKSWLNSPSHRGNIESSRITHCGLGMAISSSGTRYWTHIFIEKRVRE